MSLGFRLDADKKRAPALKQPLEIPPSAARAFVEDMRAFFAQKSTIKADEIAARQLHVLPRSKARARRRSISAT
jgi:hypothetical protein